MQRVDGVVEHYGRPFAEIWFGTHPGGPATLTDDSPLEDTAGRLPYLLKVLAAVEPLSLQTHPTRRQAEEGFEREERDGPSVDGRTRIYRDPFPKPELLCALTPFDALCGFRPVSLTIDLLRRLGADSLAGHLETYGLAPTVAGLYQREIDLSAVIDACSHH